MAMFNSYFHITRFLYFGNMGHTKFIGFFGFRIFFLAGEGDSKQSKSKALNGLECAILSQNPMGVCSSYGIWMHGKARVFIIIARLCAFMSE